MLQTLFGGRSTRTKGGWELQPTRRSLRRALRPIRRASALSERASCQSLPASLNARPTRSSNSQTPCPIRTRSRAQATSTFASGHGEAPILAYQERTHQGKMCCAERPCRPCLTGAKHTFRNIALKQTWRRFELRRISLTLVCYRPKARWRGRGLRGCCLRCCSRSSGRNGRCCGRLGG